MIGFIDGKLKCVLDDGSLIVDVNGVGYNIHAVNFGALNEGDNVSLFIHTNVREDDISLWGFNTKEELSIFKLLLSVSGVGAKTAINLITVLGHDQIVTSIYNSDSKELKVKGVGGKTAEKIILDLKDKVDISKVTGNVVSGRVLDDKKIENVKDALKSLGYREKDIISSLSKLDKLAINSLSEQELIKTLLLKL